MLLLHRSMLLNFPLLHGSLSNRAHTYLSFFPLSDPKPFLHCLCPVGNAHSHQRPITKQGIKKRTKRYVVEQAARCRHVLCKWLRAPAPRGLWEGKAHGLIKGLRTPTISLWIAWGNPGLHTRLEFRTKSLTFVYHNLNDVYMSSFAQERGSAGPSTYSPKLLQHPSPS